MAKLNKKRVDAEIENDGADDKSALDVVDNVSQDGFGDNEYVFYLASAPDTECFSGLADEHGEIPLHFIDRKVRLQIPSDHSEQMLLKKRMLAKHFELIHSPEISQSIKSELSKEAVANKEVEYWVYQHTDRVLYGESYSGEIALKIDSMTSEVVKCEDGLIKVSDPKQAKALADAGYIEVTVQYK